MLKKIYKYPIPVVTGQFQLELPKSVELVHAGPDPEGQLCMWFEHSVDEEDDKATFDFVLVGTGQTYESENRNFLATVNNGPFMWHIFQTNVDASEA